MSHDDGSPDPSTWGQISAPLDPQPSDTFHGLSSSRTEEAKEPSERAFRKKIHDIFPWGIQRPALISAMGPT